MIVKIVCAGESSFKEMYQKENNEYIIAVDGGANDLLEMNIPIQLAMGDFDSFDVTFLLNIAEKVIKFPVQKNYSDLELAIQHISDWNIERVDIYNGMGIRQDHFVSTLHVLRKYSHLPMYLMDPYNKIYVISEDRIISKDNYEYVSFFSYEVGTLISLKGVMYPLENYELNPDDTLCLSNQIVEEEAFIFVNGKPLLVIQSKE